MGKLFYFFSAVKIPLFSNPKTLKRHFSLFNLSAVDMPLLKAQACWSEPLLWVRNFLYHSSGRETWKNYFIFFSAAKIPPFSNPKTSKRHCLFFNLSTVDLPLLKAQACWREPLLWVLNFLYHSSGVETWKNYFIFSAAKIPHCSNPKTSKRHFLFYNLSAVDFPLLKAQACWSEPLLWVRNFLYHSSGLETWETYFIFFSAVKIPLFSNPKTLKRHFSLFNLSAVDMPLLKAQACWSEPLLWVRNFLYHSSGRETWKNFFIFFQQPKFPLFQTLRP